MQQVISFLTLRTGDSSPCSLHLDGGMKKKRQKRKERAQLTIFPFFHLHPVFFLHLSIPFLPLFSNLLIFLPSLPLFLLCSLLPLNFLLLSSPLSTKSLSSSYPLFLLSPPFSLIWSSVCPSFLLPLCLSLYVSHPNIHVFSLSRTFLPFSFLPLLTISCLFRRMKSSPSLAPCSFPYLTVSLSPSLLHPSIRQRSVTVVVPEGNQTDASPVAQSEIKH